MTDYNKNLLIEVPMPIRTPRLSIRIVQPGDGAELHKAKLETFDELHKWMPWAKERGTEDELEAVLREAHAKSILREDFMMVGFETATDRPVICTGLHRFDWETRDFEIGYWVRKSAWSKGYATESTIALTRYAFEVFGARRVGIDHADGNEGSRRVIEKVGFTPEGVKKLGIKLGDSTLVDRYCYGMVNPKDLPELDVKWGPP